MNNKMGWICGLAAGIGVAVCAGVPASAAKPVAIEKELLGVRVLQNYREVLRRYGAPTRVFRATETVTYQEAVNLSGAGTGGILGIADGATGGGGGGSMGGMMGGGQMGGGRPGGQMMGAMMGGGRPGGQMAGAAAMAGPGGDFPGMSGGSGGGNSGGGGGGGAQGDNAEATYAEAGGFTWVYLPVGKRLAYEFHFNKDGRVERIAELGNMGGQRTSRGIGLGDSLDKIYSVYGWTDSIKEEEPGKFSLLYNDKYHAQFLVLKNKVIGISVFLKENQFMRFDGGAGGSGMVAGASGGGPGGMMGGGMTGGGQMGARPGGQMGGKMGGGQDSQSGFGGGGGKKGGIPPVSRGQ